ncbi:beta strand repeat-containing protein, partial [Zhengella sp. ZM62]|uniref:beta strand repeat-containing protein n=1 Tax=Zhengella sedimenti TaxID=3390035 RepID=UPI003976900C
YNVAVRQTDDAGNTSAETTATYELDTTVANPVAPDLISDLANDTGSSNSDDVTNNDSPQFIINLSPPGVGTLEAGDIVQLTSGGVVYGEYVATGLEGNSITIAVGDTVPGSSTVVATSLPEGTTSLATTVIDPAGNTSTGPTLDVTLDTTIATLGAPDLVPASDSGDSDSDNLTNDDTPTFSIDVSGAEAGDVVELLVGGASLSPAVTYVVTGSETGPVELTAGTLSGDGSYDFTVSITDAAGNTTTSPATTITVDTTAPVAPVITGTTHDTLGDGINDATPTISGTGEAGATVTVTVNDGSSDIATLTTVVDGTGNWSITPATPLVSETGTHTLTFTATQTDIAGNESGVSGTQTVNLDFSPEVLGYVDNSNTYAGDKVNDGTGSVVENADGAPGENTGFITTTGDILFEDLPTGQTYTVSVSPGAGAVGLFQAGISDDTLADTNGAVTWTYQYDAAAADQLAEGQTITSTFNVTITDSNGDSTTETITVTIVGTNDAPVIEVVGTDSDSASHTEDDAGFTASGTLSVSDVDTTDAVNATVTGVVSSGTGADDLPVGLDNAALLSLLTVGTNPVIAGGSTSGTIDWSFDSGGEAFDFLDAGDELVLTYTIQVDDGSGTGNATATQEVTITITGTNDAAVVTGTSTGAVTEDAGTPATGDLDHTDADSDDADDAWNTTVVTQGTYGTLTMNADGTWSYVLDDTNTAVDVLDAGDPLQDTIVVATTDGTEHTITIDITGADDAAVITADTTGAVTEGDVGDPAVTATGSIAVSDVDGDDNPSFSSVTAAGTYGSIAVNPAGDTWTYTLDQSAVQDLDDGDIVHDVITLTDSEGNTVDIDITITGTNDAAVVTGTSTGAVTEDAGTPATGDLDHTDVDGNDADDAWNTTVVTQGSYGTLTMNADGTWSYVLDDANPAVDELDAGDPLQDTIVVATTDGTEHTITIDITGTNDAAVVTGDSTGAVTEDAGTPATGNLDHTDVDGDDADDAWNTTVVTQGSYGTLTMNADGTWSYALDDSNPAVDVLDAGDPLQDTIVVATTDGTEHTITIDITGADDDAVITADTTGAVTEGDVGDPAVTATGSIAVSDVDGDDNPSFSGVTATGTYGSVAVNLAGDTWTYTLDQSLVQDLNPGEIVHDVVTLTDSEGNTVDIDITINGTNDAPVVSGPVTDTTNDQAAPLTVDLLANASDADAGGTLGDDLDVASVSITGLVDGSTAWAETIDYTVDPETGELVIDPTQFNSLDETQTVVLTVTYNVVDEDGAVTPATATVTVNGTNDAPFVIGTTGLEDSVTEIEDGSTTPAEGTPLTTSGTIEFDDPELADTHSVSITPSTGGYIGTLSGGFSGSATGAGTGEITWTFTVSDAVIDQLGEGDTITQTYDLVITDNHGASTTGETITITITGTNDRPVISSVTTPLDVTEATDASAQTVSVSGDLTVSDDDHGGTFTGGTSTADVLTASVTGDATWSYTPDGGTPTTLPSGVSIATLIAAGNIVFTGNDASATGSAQTIGYDYTATDDLDWLGEGDELVLTYEVVVTDDSGASDAESATQTITITINGTNDAPEVTAIVSAADEGDASYTLDLLENATDADTGETATLTISGVEYTVDGGSSSTTPPAGVSLSGTMLAVDPADPAYDYLAEGEDLVITVSYDVVDEHGASTPQTATVTITGTNDAPVVAAVTGSASEDGPAITVSA